METNLITDTTTTTTTTKDTATKPALVLGATGKTGRRVVDRLAALGHPVRIGSRSADPRFDWEEPATWQPALTGCGSVYITYQPDLGMPGSAEAVGAFAETAVAAGATRLVLLSGRGEPQARRAEKAVQSSGAEWTIVRSAFFAQNFSEHLFVEAISAGELAMVADGVGEPFVDAEDIADVVTVALTQPGHVGRVYEVTGPRLVTFAEATALIAEAIGRDIGYRRVSVDEFASGLAEVGLPTEDAVDLGQLLSEVLDGRNAYTTDGVREALGRAPRDFSDYVRTSAKDGVWHG